MTTGDWFTLELIILILMGPEGVVLLVLLEGVASAFEVIGV